MSAIRGYVRCAAFAVLLCGWLLSAQSTAFATLPQGILLPVQLGHTLTAGKTPVGASIVVKTTQRIPLGEHTYIEKGALVHGEVLASAHGDGTPARPAILQLRFTALEYQHQAISLQVKAIAIANFTDVADTGTPILGSVGPANSGPANWTTRQVGGDEVFRQLWVGGLYDISMHVVGSADEHGVYSLPEPIQGSSAQPLPRALGVFSASATGLYGFGDGCTLRADDGTITLTRIGKTLKLRDGDDLLLQVVAAK